MTKIDTLIYVTKQYDAMKQFFVDLGLDVPEQDNGWQIFPVFNRGRACPISLKATDFCLEECTDTPPSGPLYLDVGDIGVARLLRFREKYPVTEVGQVSWDPSSPPIFR